MLKIKLRSTTHIFQIYGTCISHVTEKWKFQFANNERTFQAINITRKLFVYHDNRYHTQTLLYLPNGTPPSPRQAQQLSILFHFTGVHLPFFFNISINIRTSLTPFKKCAGTIIFRFANAHRM